jgi:hypothetical protein
MSAIANMALNPAQQSFIFFAENTIGLTSPILLDSSATVD